MKRIFLLVLIVVAGQFAKAQSLVRVFGGLTIPKYSYENTVLSISSKQKSNPGFTGGVMLSSTIEKEAGIGFNLGLSYVQKGAMVKNPAPGVNEIKSRLNYAQLDVVLNKMVGNDGALHGLGIFAGAFYGYAVNGQQKTTIGSTTVSSDLNFGGNNGSNQFYHGDLGGTFGFILSGNRVSFLAKYDLGVIDIVPNTDIKAKSTNIQFTLGFNLGK